MTSQTEKTHVIIDLGPSTMIMLSEIILVSLKLMNVITWSWMFVLAPIAMVICGATLILLFTLLRMLRRHIF